MKNIKIVIGANFGDEGKGKMTDFYTNHKDDSIVVCSNGGAQRGHTVLKPDGTRHVFHHFGSGTFNNAATYLPEDFILNPLVFRKEYEELKDMGYEPTVFINNKCIITYPLDMMANQIIEESRGENKHGSCGMGIFNTIQRHKKGNMSYFQIKRYYTDLFKSMGITLTEQQKELFYNDDIESHFWDDFYFMMEHSEIVYDNQLLNNYDTIVFENGQGLLLDQNNTEYFPHLTPSNTGTKNPARIIKEVSWSGSIDIEVCYVTRSYMTRHGAGAFPTECNKDEINADMFDQTNIPNPHQDTLRYGKLDVEDLIKRCNTDIMDLGLSCKRVLAVTHMNEYFDNVYDIGTECRKNNWEHKFFYKEANNE